MENLRLSDRLRTVLQDLQQITDAIAKIEMPTGNVANDDSLPRQIPAKKDV